MIRVEVQEYCELCCDFEPDVTKPVKNTIYKGNEPYTVTQSDTIIRCLYRKRCENIKRFLSHQSKGDAQI